MRKAKAFTLVELLIVVGIIALLIALIMPSLGRARDLAKRAVCATKLHAHGRALTIYVSESDSYPFHSPYIRRCAMWWDDNSWTDDLQGWPKFYAILESQGIPGTRRTIYGNWGYTSNLVSNIWDGCFCPAMDAPRLLAAANKAGDLPYDGNWFRWVWPRKWAAGYQWSPFLCAAVPFVNYDASELDLPHRTRYPNTLTDDYGVDKFQWGSPGVQLRDGNRYWTMAVNPGELAQPGKTAEAWDSWDLQSLPNVAWGTTGQLQTIGGAWTPGWHRGIATAEARAILNGWRHKGCPSILYADGHIASDASREVDPATDGLDQAIFGGMQAYTWDNYDDLFGNMDHLLPRCEFGD